MEAIFFIVVIYLLPTIVAIVRSRTNTGSILVVNLFLGWTLIGWVAALAWSVAHDDSQVQRKDPAYQNQSRIEKTNPNDGWWI